MFSYFTDSRKSPYDFMIYMTILMVYKYKHFIKKFDLKYYCSDAECLVCSVLPGDDHLQSRGQFVASCHPRLAQSVGDNFIFWSL